MWQLVYISSVQGISTSNTASSVGSINGYCSNTYVKIPFYEEPIHKRNPKLVVYKAAFKEGFYKNYFPKNINVKDLINLVLKETNPLFFVNHMTENKIEICVNENNGIGNLF